MSIVAMATNGLVVCELNYKAGVGGVRWCDPFHRYTAGTVPLRWASAEAAAVDLAEHAPMVAQWVAEGSVKLVEGPAVSEPTTAPLAALLASHPEECAAVVAALAITDPCDGRSTSGIVEDVALYFPALPRLDVGEVGVICDACCAAGFAELDRWGDYAIVEGADRYAIARMGAAAWLDQRCPPAPSSPSFDDREQASRDRLCDIHAMAVHYKHPTARAIRSILIGAGNGVPVGRDKYRGLLVRIGAYGVPLDVDAEVAAVWGQATAEGAQAPKGERR